MNFRAGGRQLAVSLEVLRDHGFERCSEAQTFANFATQLEIQSVGDRDH